MQDHGTAPRPQGEPTIEAVISALPRGAERGEVRGSNIVIADGLRATAILMIVAYHLIWLSKPTIRGHEVSFGYLGTWAVNCFFVLTGFLLGRPYLAAMLDRKALPSMRLFFVRRLLRIYPLYAVAVLSTAAMFALSTRAAPTAHDIIAHLFFLHGLSPATIYSFNSPLWTMAVDASFYLTLPFAMFFLKWLLAAKDRATCTAIIAGSIAAAAAFSIPYRFVQYELHPLAMTDYAMMTVYVRNMVGMSSAFGIGLAIALLAVLKVKVAPWVCIVLAALGLSLAAVQLIVHLEVSQGHSMIAVLRMALVDPLAALSVGLIVFALVCSRLSFATLPVAMIQRTAAISYAAYLFHMPLLSVVHAIVLRAATGTGSLLALAVIGLPAVFALAWLAHRFIEKPLLELKSHFREA